MATFKAQFSSRFLFLNYFSNAESIGGNWCGQAVASAVHTQENGSAVQHPTLSVEGMGTGDAGGARR